MINESIVFLQMYQIVSVISGYICLTLLVIFGKALGNCGLWEENAVFVELTFAIVFWEIHQISRKCQVNIKYFFA
jgi:hypothetical protein